MKTGFESDRPPREDVRFREVLSEVLSPHDRTNLSSDLSLRSERRVSLAMINAYASRSNDSAKFPAYLVPMLCEILDDDRLQRFLMGPRLRKLVEFAERELAGFRDQREREVLRDELLNGASQKPLKAGAPKP